MIRLRLKPDLIEAVRFDAFSDDVASFQLMLAARGFEASARDVFSAWCRHSEESCAGWLAPFGDDDRNCSALLKHLEPYKIA